MSEELDSQVSTVSKREWLMAPVCSQPQLFYSEKEMDQVTTAPRTASKFLIGALIGSAVGATAGILFAPRSGQRTRAMLQEKGTEFTENLKKKFKK